MPVLFAFFAIAAPPLCLGGQAGPGLHPVQESDPGYADDAAQAAHGEILAPGQRIGGGLADVEVIVIL